MKKIITLCVAVLMAAMTVNAKEYKHSVGMVAGLGIGAQYKTMVQSDFTIIAEAGYFMNLNGGTGAYAGHTAMAIGGFHYINDNLMLNAGVSWGNSSESAYRVGLTYSW